MLMHDSLDLDAIYHGLSDKQAETLDLIGEGRTHKEIAHQLGISVSAATQRVEVLRAKFGGATKAAIARIHRQHGENVTYKVSTGKNFHLPPLPSDAAIGSRPHGDSSRGLSDSAPVFQFGDQWESLKEPHVVPEVLDGENASTFRWVAVLGIAIGLLAMVILMVTAAQTIGSLN